MIKHSRIQTIHLVGIRDGVRVTVQEQNKTPVDLDSQSCVQKFRLRDGDKVVVCIEPADPGLLDSSSEAVLEAKSGSDIELRESREVDGAEIDGAVIEAFGFEVVWTCETKNEMTSGSF